jgi:hypothetical protein
VGRKNSHTTRTDERGSRHWAEVRLQRVTFGGPLVLAGVGEFRIGDDRKLDEGPLRPRMASWRTDTEGGQPRVLCLWDTNVRNLVLSNVDLRACRFIGAHNLDELRIEGNSKFGTTPQPGSIHPGGWTTRHTIAEEHHWRNSKPRAHRRKGWYGPAYRAPWLGKIDTPKPVEIAGLYRALRKGREDSKDEPGAADFYYGEMDMRREARHQRAKGAWRKEQRDPLYVKEAARLGYVGGGADRACHLVAVLGCSSYALRAWRAFGVLLGVLLIATFLIALVGFPPPPVSVQITGTITGGSTVQHVQLDLSPAPPVSKRSFVARCGAAWWIALEAAVFRSPDQTLRPVGRHVQTVVRVFGPVLLALALLSIRGRVKR